MNIPKSHSFLSLLSVLLLASRWSVQADPARIHQDRSDRAPEVVLAKDGRALMDIVIPAGAPEAVGTAAADLARILRQMSGAAFNVVTSATERSGIVIGTAADFPGLRLEKTLPFTAAEDRNHYILRTAKDRILCIGVTGFGASHAVYDLLHRIGCRWFYPFPNWEAIPARPEIRVRADVEERPDYFMFISPADAWGRGDWNRRNRNHSSPYIYTQHSLGGIVNALDKAGKLKDHPEYNALQPTNPERRVSWWPCLSNPGARQLIVEYVLDFLRKEPERDSLSLEPADGDGWCICPACGKSSPIDLLVTLANEAAAGLEREFPKRFVYIGILAYNRHSFPPTIGTHPRVGVFPTTGFNYSGLSTENLLKAWKAKMAGPYLGLYDYWFMPVWHNGLIGAKGGQVEYMRRIFPEYYKLGLRMFQPECIEGWGPNGLAYYVANRLAWNVDTDVDAVVDDFVKTLFGKAATPMMEFYRRLNRTPDFRMSRDYRGRLFASLAEARTLERDPAVVGRLDEMTLYVGYVEQYFRWRAGEIAFEDVMSYLWRANSTTPLFDKNKWIWKYLPTYHRLKRPLGRGDDIPDNWQARDRDMPDDQDPWKGPGLFTPDEILKINTEGVARNPTIRALDNPPTFSRNLVPANSTFQDPMPISGKNTNIRLYAREDGVPPPLRSWGQTKWTLSRYDAGTDRYADVESGETPADDEMHDIVFRTRGAGLYALQANCSSKATNRPLAWDDRSGHLITMDISDGQWGPGSNRWGWFLVPAGTRQVAIWMSDVRQVVYGSNGAKILYDGRQEKGGADVVAIDVPEGEDGKIWKLYAPNYVCTFALLNVPPYVAASPNQLLMPAECRYTDP